MTMKTVTRVLIAAVVAPTLAFGLPTAAFADSFYKANSTFAGPKGAGSHSICSSATGHGHGHGKFGHGIGHGIGHHGFGRGIGHGCVKKHHGHHGNWIH